MSLDRRKRRRHMARAQRERRFRRMIYAGIGALVVIVVGVLGYGWYDVNVRQPAQPVITVNGEGIARSAFRARARLIQRQLLGRYQSTLQLQSLFGEDEQTQGTIQAQLEQLRSQLTTPSILGQQVIEQMIGDVLVHQEAERRGLAVTEAEVQQVIHEAFGYFPEGTPTPVPTPSPDPSEVAAATAAASTAADPTATVALPTPVATEEEGADTTPELPTPVATATAYTQEMFEQEFAAFMDQLQSEAVEEEDYRAFIRADLYRQKLLDAFREETSRVQEQVHARHILVPDEETAQEVLTELEDGRDWEELAAEYSTDASNADRGGDLGWFGRGRMVEPFEEAAFSAEVGEIIGPVETNFGYHLIEVLGHEERELQEAAFEQTVQIAFSEWLSQAQSEADIEIAEDWLGLVPTVTVPQAGGGF